MRRLAGADSQFIFSENRVEHQHTMKVAVLGAEGRVPLSFELWRDAIARAVPHIQPLRWRLVKVPFRLGHPYWIDDPDLDIDYHVRRAAVPSPGGDAEFAEVISNIASVGLERDRPLWQLWFVEGLAGGRVAWVMKLHHAVADGGSAARMLLDTFAESPDDDYAIPRGRAPKETPPSPGGVAARALVDTARIVGGLPSVVDRTRRYIAAGRDLEKAGHALPPPFASPHVRFNEPLTPHRWIAFARLPLAEVRLVKDALGATVNDVFLAACASGIRRYLLDHDELPTDSLLASVPVSTRRPDEADDWGNHTNAWFVHLGTDQPDPVARLRTIQADMANNKANDDVRDNRLFESWMELWPLWSAWRRGTTGPLGAVTGRHTSACIISNVRGPTRPLYSGGHELVDFWSTGPLVGDLGLNITGWSYVDRFNVTVLACRERVPDVWALAAGIEAGLAELVVASRAGSTPARPTS